MYNNNRNRNNRNKNNKKSQEKNGVDFLNPYNFVTPLDYVPRDSYTSFQSKNGLTGKITCSLKTLNKLFIPDRNDEYSFYKNDQGEFTIPASSLKGMLRVVIEAISNSCFVVITDDTAYTYSVPLKELKNIVLKPGRINQMPTSSKAGQVKLMEKANIECDRVESYRDLDIMYITIRQDENGVKVVDDIKSNLSEYEKDIIDKKGSLQKGKGKIHKGYLYKTKDRYGPFLNKKNEKVFYQTKTDDELETFDFTEKMMEDYNYIVEQKCKDTNKEANMHRCLLKDKDENRLIYFTLNNNKIEFVSNTEVPKFRYKYSPQDLIENQGLKACSDINDLCYSCRLFGMIGGKNNLSSYKGRLDFADAKITQAKYNKDTYFKTTGALSSPKPQQTLFYLQDKKDYNNPEAKIRGRKFYFHGEPRIEATEKPNNIKNSSSLGPMIFSPLEKDTCFEFTINFNNLNSTELGLLLYAINLEEGLAHKIGSAKGYGMGSVKLKVDSLVIEDEKTKYQNFNLKDCLKDYKNKIEDYIKLFKENFYGEIKEAYSNKGLHLESNSFENLINIKHLKAIFNIDLGKFKKKVYYPSKDKKSFKWFAKNEEELIYPDRIKASILSTAKKNNSHNVVRKQVQAKKQTKEKIKIQTEKKKYKGLFLFISGEYGEEEVRKASKIASTYGMNHKYIIERKKEFEAYKKNK